MTEDSAVRTDALQAAADRRVELKQAMSGVEMAAASPSAGPGWADKLMSGLEELRIALNQHVEEVEAADGLLDELTHLAPRLVNQIGHVRDEHPVLQTQLEETIALAGDPSDVSKVRASVLDLLLAIARHRQKGADLVYEGYNVDIGGN